MRRYVSAALVILALGFAVCAAGQTPEGEKEQDIRRLLKLTRASEIGVQVIEQSLAEVRAAFGAFPADRQERIAKEFEGEMRKEFSEEKMIDMIIPIYSKHLTHGDVKALIAFYESPAGQKLSSVMPIIAKEAWEAGARRGEEVAHRVVERLVAQGVIQLPKSEPAPPPPAGRTNRRRP